MTRTTSSNAWNPRWRLLACVAPAAVFFAAFWLLPVVRLLALPADKGAATYFAVRHEFLEQLEDQLHDDFEGAEGALARGVDDRIVWILGIDVSAHPVEPRIGILGFAVPECEVFPIVTGEL